MRKIGSQCRDSLDYSGYTLHKRINNNEVILMAYDKVLQLWVAKDDYAGYVIEIDGIGYEFICSVNAEDIHRLEELSYELADTNNISVEENN